MLQLFNSCVQLGPGSFCLLVGKSFFCFEAGLLLLKFLGQLGVTGLVSLFSSSFLSKNGSEPGSSNFLLESVGLGFDQRLLVFSADFSFVFKILHDLVVSSFFKECLSLLDCQLGTVSSINSLSHFSGSLSSDFSFGIVIMFPGPSSGIFLLFLSSHMPDLMKSCGSKDVQPLFIPGFHFLLFYVTLLVSPIHGFLMSKLSPLQLPKSEHLFLSDDSDLPCKSGFPLLV
jgi:hypothetical protein